MTTEHLSILFDRELLVVNDIVTPEPMEVWEMPAFSSPDHYHREGAPKFVALYTRKFFYAGRAADSLTKVDLLRFFVEGDKPFAADRHKLVLVDLQATRGLGRRLLTQHIGDLFVHGWLEGAR